MSVFHARGSVSNAMVVSHVPQRKIAGALHEATGVGFVNDLLWRSPVAPLLGSDCVGKKKPLQVPRLFYRANIAELSRDAF